MPGGEIADGPDDVAETYRALFSAFPDLSAPDLDPSSLCHRGNLVIGETRLQGTHMRTFRGLRPTGRRIDMPLVAIFVFDGPDLLCERVYWDRLPCSSSSASHGSRTPELASLRLCPTTRVTLTRAALRSRRLGT